MEMDMAYYIGVDVGTASVRAALVCEKGSILETSEEPIIVWNQQPSFYEQSSENIWKAVITVVNDVMSQSKISPDQVKGLGFDATCSLVALDSDFKPISCSLSGKADCNIIMWMDHRAEDQAQRINATKHSVLRYVGGTMSLEMQPPKLLWLKERLPAQWNKMANLFDLPDYLTWRATDSQTRSLCSLVCKWGYEAQTADKHGWNDEFLAAAGLEELSLNGHCRIGQQALYPGECCGSGLTALAAKELGLVQGTPVGASLIDAHAGGMACLACVPASLPFQMPPLTSRLVLVCGTSTCHMMVSNSPIFVPGVWGPYFSAMMPKLWASEGGQSATGKLIDFMVENHPAYLAAKSAAEERNIHLYEYLNTMLEHQAHLKGVTVAHLTADLHVYPDFHGNRSPLADPSMKGMICGLTLSVDVDNLAIVYLSTIQALTYGTKHIISEMRNSGHNIQLLYLCGGLRKNRLFVQTHADVLGLPVILPDTKESVLLGAAILGACASGNFKSIQDAMLTMGGGGTVILPREDEKRYHENKYKVHIRMLADQKAYRDIMKD
ncbi:FGGY carbohydrate kinase domain-containing protein-like isoform X2 [Pomacea canaliculata]|nr:FGGY carbohydrate kinase domain-containing protein-like isoform X2 [Pomacea canaliculata]XP_025109638.1 FGGY carbohydrate kinase domain-containing protein-like isoform X2 [Pomacea canaliculata]XP_025109639.1 FGGY carbohydrate kinase domain-containing protein-like isoform X2 [Pomacea canaliculata]XP_025109640.1 FGGY carbohydrate kinase domain-containing protein-like isoform X2 [Pomacea canaliculata]XP_025109641.1 FGGY carbohydrate kinase domain-containing protein-like isoform X2 [Pomacea cana